MSSSFHVSFSYLVNIGKQRKNLASMTVNDFSIAVVGRVFDTKLILVMKSFVLEDLLAEGDSPYFLMAGPQKNQKTTSPAALTLNFADVRSFSFLFSFFTSTLFLLHMLDQPSVS